MLGSFGGFGTEWGELRDGLICAISPHNANESRGSGCPSILPSINHLAVSTEGSTPTVPKNVPLNKAVRLVSLISDGYRLVCHVVSCDGYRPVCRFRR
jgi:hypothetical protein